MANKTSPQNKAAPSTPSLDAPDDAPTTVGAAPAGPDIAALQAELAAAQKRNRELEAALVTGVADAAELAEDDVAIPGDRPKVGAIHAGTNRPIFNVNRPTGKSG